MARPKTPPGQAINAVGKMPASFEYTPFATGSKINHIRLRPSLLLLAGLSAGHTCPFRFFQNEAARQACNVLLQPPAPFITCQGAAPHTAFNRLTAKVRFESLCKASNPNASPLPLPPPAPADALKDREINTLNSRLSNADSNTSIRTKTFASDDEFQRRSSHFRLSTQKSGSANGSLMSAPLQKLTELLRHQDIHEAPRGDCAMSAKRKNEHQLFPPSPGVYRAHVLAARTMPLARRLCLLRPPPPSACTLPGL